MGADDDAVAGLEAQEGLEDGGGGGVGGGDHRGDDAHGLRDLHDAVSLVLFDDAAGLGVLIGVVDILCGIVVLDDLIFHHAHAGLLHGHFGQGDTGLVGGGGSGQEDPVYLLLGIGGKDRLGPADPGKCRFQGLQAVHKGILYVAVHYSSSYLD